jgi:hypothetical protein
MKTHEQRQIEARREHTEAIVAQHVSKLFQRLPMLSGFWLGPDLELAEVSIFAWPGFNAGSDVYDEVMQSLVDLGEERPEAMQLIRGRSFARAVH